MGVFGGADNQVTANVMTDNGENGIFWGSGHTGGRLAANLIARNPGSRDPHRLGATTPRSRSTTSTATATTWSCSATATASPPT